MQLDDSAHSLYSKEELTVCDAHGSNVAQSTNPKAVELLSIESTLNGYATFWFSLPFPHVIFYILVRMCVLDDYLLQGIWSLIELTIVENAAPTFTV